MFSCDTFALTKEFFTGNQNFLAKNSDRPLGERSPCPFFPAAFMRRAKR